MVCVKSFLVTPASASASASASAYASACFSKV
jgi:hypothetical protein